MGYQVTEKLLPLGKSTNRPGTPLRPVGVVIHETATPGATAANEYRYFAGGYRGASAHYFVDDKTILRVIPENEMAWHAGPTANKQYLSIELCHFKEAARFEEVWKRGVWLAADMCRRYGWDPDKAIRSHAWVSKTWRETDHMDPEGYFAAHGKSMEQFIADVKKELAGRAIKEVPSVFQDIAGHWAEGEIRAAADIGLVAKAELFRPDEKATRAEVVVLMMRLYRLLTQKGA